VARVLRRRDRCSLRNPCGRAGSAAQSTNQLAAIDAETERIVQHRDVRGAAEQTRGFTIDDVGRLAFITSEDNAPLLVIELWTMRVVTIGRVGSSPGVLAWDPAWQRLYVDFGPGVVSAFVHSWSRMIR
jgi:DNA-binding beta-propeller fold protein YncE